MKSLQGSIRDREAETARDLRRGPAALAARRTVDEEAPGCGGNLQQVALNAGMAGVRHDENYFLRWCRDDGDRTGRHQDWPWTPAALVSAWFGGVGTPSTAFTIAATSLFPVPGHRGDVRHHQHIERGEGLCVHVPHSLPVLLARRRTERIPQPGERSAQPSAQTGWHSLPDRAAIRNNGSGRRRRGGRRRNGGSHGLHLVLQQAAFSAASSCRSGRSCRRRQNAPCRPCPSRQRPHRWSPA